MSSEPRVRLKESGGWTPWTLTREQAGTLSESELVEIGTGPGDTWKLRARGAKGVVGAVRLGRGPAAVQLSIAPKIPIDRILYLLGYAADHIRWSEEPVDGAARPDLLPAVGYAFARSAGRALRPGALLGYRETEDTLPVLRGRLRSSAQLRRRPGLALPLEVVYDDHTTDIPENQLLLGAVRRLLRTPGLDPGCRTALHGLAGRLDGVVAPVPGAPLPRWAPTRLNRRYQQALGLAALILNGDSYELDNGRLVRVDGMLMTMWRVYETFLGQALGEALRQRAGGRAETRDTSYSLDVDRRHPLKPDLVHYLSGPAVVADAKYKPERERGDLYQMLAYCIRFGLKDGHLVYVSGVEDIVHVPVGEGIVRLHRHVLDLTLPHQDLQARIGVLADTILSARSRALL
ncbi:McrC family protein [Streptomyces sp. RKAG337]|uniref:McrC family protein n=1 Tax=Streptomyces sp. RKAG337 TaxID=2893404 RepID=UPI002033CA36|nr:McrC family protein [Streptomyces sp. RKAG337]MCM2429200.1 McrC family protein [Streptomyces sp. RKAG337]